MNSIHRENYPDPINDYLEEVRTLMVSSLEETSLRFLLNDSKNIIGQGKMLRSRLIFRVGKRSGVARDLLVHAGAAVDMIHAASLLHDDVIDGGLLRRQEPTFWVKRGIPGAILVGDFLLFKAIEIMCRVEDVRFVHSFVKYTGEVCQGESEQELLFRGQSADWSTCVRIARKKTGALFAFSGGICGGTDESLVNVLTESGYLVGTAYQLADDILDAKGDPGLSDKTLGTDEVHAKMTAMCSFPLDIDSVKEIHKLCSTAKKSLESWPKIQEGWKEYMAKDMGPVLQKNVAALEHKT